MHALPLLPTGLWICVLKLLALHALGRAAGVRATASTLVAENAGLQRQLAVERAGAGVLRAKIDQLDAEVVQLRAALPSAE